MTTYPMAQPVQTVAAPTPAPYAVVSTAPPQSTLKVAAIRGLGMFILLYRNFNQYEGA